MNIGKEISRRRFLELTAALGGVVACGNPTALFALNKQGVELLGPRTSICELTASSERDDLRLPEQLIKYAAAGIFWRLESTRWSKLIEQGDGLGKEAQVPKISP